MPSQNPVTSSDNKPASVETPSLTVALPGTDAKIKRLTAKEFKASLPDTLTPKQKREAYDAYAAEFSALGHAALSAKVNAGELRMVAAKCAKTGRVTATYAEVKPATAKVQRATIATLKADADAKAKRIAELEAMLAKQNESAPALTEGVNA